MIDWDIVSGVSYAGLRHIEHRNMGCDVTLVKLLRITVIEGTNYIGRDQSQGSYYERSRYK